jgi:hypothetical protein
MAKPEEERKNSPEPETIKPAEIVYLKGKIPTPLDMLGFSLEYWCGRVGDSFEVVPALTAPPYSPKDKSFLSLHQKNHLKYWRTLIPEVADRFRSHTKDAERTLNRMANYLSYCQPEEGKDPPLLNLAKQGASFYLYQHLVDISVRFRDQPAEALMASRQLLEDMVRGDIDPFTCKRDIWDANQEDMRSYTLNACFEASQGNLFRYIDLPGFGPTTSFQMPVLREESGQGAEKTKIEKWLTLERRLATLRVLENERVRITIVGPANSGKSTLTASLYFEINEILRQVRTSSLDFADLRLTCGIMNLDKPTPDAEKISRGGTDFSRQKIPWTQDLAAVTAREFIGMLQNIVLADAPGGSPDEITRTVVGPTDLVFLLIRADGDQSWLQQRDQWLAALSEIGQTPVAVLRRRLSGERSQFTGEPLESTITSFQPEEVAEGRGQIERVGGRAVIDRRAVLKGDPCVSTLARLLLFDFLPTVISTRMAKTHRYLMVLRDQQAQSKVFFEILQKKIRKRHSPKS